MGTGVPPLPIAQIEPNSIGSHHPFRPDLRRLPRAGTGGLHRRRSAPAHMCLAPPVDSASASFLTTFVSVS